MSIADQVIEKYKNQPLPQADPNSQQSVSDRVIARYKTGNGTAAPTPAEDHTSIFSKFIDYVKRNSVEAAKGSSPLQWDNPNADKINSYQDINTAQKIAGAVATPVYAAKDLFNLVTTPERKLGQYLGEGAVAEDYVSMIDTNNATIMKWREIAKNAAKDETKKRAADAIVDLMDKNKKLAEESGGEISKQTNRQLVGLSLEVATDFATAGMTTIASKFFKVGKSLEGASKLTKVLSSPVVESTAIGAFYGLTGKMQEEGDKTYEDYKSGVKTGALFGLGLGIAGKIAGKLLGGGKLSEEGGQYLAKEVDNSTVGMGIQYGDLIKAGEPLPQKMSDHIVGDIAGKIKMKFKGTYDDIAAQLEKEMAGKTYASLADMDTAVAAKLGELGMTTDHIAQLAEEGGVLAGKFSKGKEVKMPFSDKKPTMADIVTKTEPTVVLRPELKRTGTPLEDILKAPEAEIADDVDKIIADSGFVKVTTAKTSQLPAMEGKTAKGKARYDFETGKGEIVVAKDATPSTKAHEFAHVANYKIGDGEKITTQIDKFVSGQTDEVPAAIVKYTEEKLGKGVTTPEIMKAAKENASKISTEMKAAARINVADTFRLKNSSEEFSTAVANSMMKRKQVQEVAPMFYDFIKSQTRKKQAVEMANATIKKMKKNVVDLRKPQPKPVVNKPKVVNKLSTDEVAAREYVRSKKTAKLRRKEDRLYTFEYDGKRYKNADYNTYQSWSNRAKHTGAKFKLVKTSDAGTKYRSYNTTRYADKGRENTDKFRGGTWHTIGEEKNYKFGGKDFGGVGGKKKFAGKTNADNPLVIKNASLEDGSFAVINSGYENYLPVKERKLANTLADITFDSSNKKVENTIKKVLKENGNTEDEIKAVLASTNKIDSAFDLVVSRGLKKEGYDALILQNEFQGKVVDEHMFKFAEEKPKSLEVKKLIDSEGEPITKTISKIPDNEKSMTKGAIDVVKTEDGYMVLDGQHRASEALKLGQKNIDVNVLSTKEALDKYGDRWPQLKSVLSDEKFRLKDDFEKATGVKIDDAQEAKIIALNKKIFGDENIKITGQIMTPEGQKALGSYRDGMIKILKGEADAVDTFYHESVHKYLDVFTTEDEQVKLIMEAKKVFKTKDYAEAEEKLAESFINYAKNRTGVTGTLKATFDAVIQRVKKYFGNEDQIKSLYADIIRGKKREDMGVIAETKKTVRVKTPALVTSGGIEVKGAKPIKSESIRLDKLNTTQDVADAIDKIAKADKDVIDVQRRGRITNDQLQELSEMTGIKSKDILNAKAGSIVNAENALAARKLMLESANELSEFTATIGNKASQDQLMEFRTKLDKFRGLQRTLAGFRSEAGRLLQQFNMKVSPAEYEVMDDLIRKIKEIDAGSASELEKSIKIGKELKPDSLFTLFVKAGVDTRTAFLLYSPTTHVANLLGNTWKALTVPLQKYIGAKIGKGIAKGEASAHMQGIKDAMPEAWANLKLDFGNIFSGKEIVGGQEKVLDITRQRNQMELLKRLGVDEKSADKADSIIKTSFKLLTASDKFFRTINFAGELYSQAMRKATEEGLTGNQMVKRIEDLIDNPMLDETFFKSITKQVEISLFQEKTKFSQFASNLREHHPITKLFVPFVQTPTNVAIETVRTSPLGFLRPTMAKMKGTSMSKAEESLAYAQASIGTALAAIAAGLVMQDKITGGLPKNYYERDKFYASGKQPYSVKIGDKWISYRRIEPAASVLGNFANATKNFKDEKDWMQATGSTVGGFVNNFFDQTFLKGISDIYNAATDPENKGKNFVQSLATSFVPSISRSIAGASDRTVRERETLGDAFKNVIPSQKGTLPAKIDIFGNEVKYEGGFVEGLISPFSRATDKQNDKTVRELEKSDYNLSVSGLDKIGNVKVEGKAKEIWLKAVGQATKKELDRVVNSPAFDKLDQYKKDEALKDAVTRVREKYRKQVLAGGLSMAFNERKQMTKTEQQSYNEDLKGKLNERIMSMSFR